MKYRSLHVQFKLNIKPLIIVKIQFKFRNWKENSIKEKMLMEITK